MPGVQLRVERGRVMTTQQAVDRSKLPLENTTVVREIFPDMELALIQQELRANGGRVEATIIALTNRF